jgi:hypothetical protein
MQLTSVVISCDGAKLPGKQPFFAADAFFRSQGNPRLLGKSVFGAK